LVVEQHAGKVETLDDAFDHGVGAFATTLHAQAATTMDQLLHYRVSEPRFNLVTQRLALQLKRRHRDGLDPRGKLVLRHRLVALGKAGNERNHSYEEDNAQG